MKKILLSITTLFTFALASAQDEPTTTGFTRGDAFISGTLSFGSEKTGDYFKNTVFTVAPSAGYFVTNNIAIGVGLGYSSSNSDINDGFSAPYEETASAFAAGVFGRYYFTPANRFTIFTDLSVAYTTIKYETDVDGGFDSESKENGFGVAFAPGINYWISNHLALETSFGILSYGTSKPDASGAESTNSFNIGLDLANINFGLVYKF